MNLMPTQQRIAQKGSMPGGIVALTRYPNGEVAIVILDDDGEELAVATVALEEAPRLSPDYVWLKGWSENTGLPLQLAEAGLVKLTGGTFPTGFAQAEPAEVLPPLAEEIAKLPKRH